MNRVEYLIGRLAEEAAEIVQECMKAQAFGLDDRWPEETSPSILERLREEIFQLYGVVEALTVEGIIPLPGTSEVREAVLKKFERIKQFMDYARQRGTLTENPDRDERLAFLEKRHHELLERNGELLEHLRFLGLPADRLREKGKP